MSRIIPTIYFLLIFTSLCFAQLDLKVHSPKKMQKDLKTLLETFEGHPDPFTKISESKFNAIVDSVRNNISTEMDEIDFYKNMSRIVASIHDGHTSLYLRGGWLENMRKKNGVFPYEVYLTNEHKLYITSSYIKDQIPLGAEVLEINGLQISDFIDEITPYISCETIPFRNDQITTSFEKMLYLVFKQVDKLEFKVRQIEEQNFIVETIDYDLWKDQKKDLRKDRDKRIAKGKPYDYQVIKPGIAKIKIFSFHTYDIKKYNIFLRKTFKDIKKQNIHSLIIDVRGNYGGWPKMSSKLFHYIHNGYFKTLARSTTKISSPYRRSFTDSNTALRNANNIDFRQSRHLLNLEEILYGKLDTYYEEDVIFNESPVTEDYEFYGDCFLLIDRKSFSAASSFASTFQCYQMGTIIGEPTGGTKIFRANAFTKKLSKTDLVVRMSSTKCFSTCYNGDDEPIQPNLVVVPTILDRVYKVDSQLNVAIQLINKLQKQKNGE